MMSVNVSYMKLLICSRMNNDSRRMSVSGSFGHKKNCKKKQNHHHGIIIDTIKNSTLYSRSGDSGVDSVIHHWEEGDESGKGLWLIRANQEANVAVIISKSLSFPSSH